MAKSPDSNKPRKSGGGCIGKLAAMMVILIGLGIGSAVFFIAKPQDLSDIGGNASGVKGVPVRDMKVVLENSLDRGYAVTLTETELNQWIGRKLKTKQGGLLRSLVTLDRVWVRLDDGVAEVITVRRIMGRPFTTSIFLKIEKFQSARELQTAVPLHGGPYHPQIPIPNKGGRFGKLVVPQGFLILVLPEFQKLSKVFEEEIELGINRMARVRIEKNRLVLDPNTPGGDASGLPHSF
jgi:hypothetical protein